MGTIKRNSSKELEEAGKPHQYPKKTQLPGSKSSNGNHGETAVLIIKCLHFHLTGLVLRVDLERVVGISEIVQCCSSLRWRVETNEASSNKAGK
jgi:hypothetical protein